ncbi:hypothetical protein [Rathayibacter sp. AY1H3]|uniref:MmyB family transcriptional regulator n=1 Tax=Rathayibacter sp. AY1H3 TaxID=2080567 RepID=UPI0021586C84|nr:hypothetical protein [Rathayibacter sp. AY1H3]
MEPALGRPQRRPLGVHRAGAEPRLAALHLGPRGHRVRRAARGGLRERPRGRPARGDLRAATGRYPRDPALAALVARLREESPEFERRWAEARIAEHRASRKTVTRTPVGPITIDCDVLTAPGTDLRIVVYTVAPGSEDEARLDLLRVTGLQALSTAPA